MKSNRYPNTNDCHSPKNPGRRRLPVSSSCIAPCLMAFFLAICFSSNNINSSMSVRECAIASCSGFGGTTISIADSCFPLVSALVVYVHPIVIAFRTASVVKQYLQYSGVNMSFLDLPRRTKPLKTQSSILSNKTDDIPTSSGVSDVLVKKTSFFCVSNRRISSRVRLTLPHTSFFFRPRFLYTSV